MNHFRFLAYIVSITCTISASANVDDTPGFLPTSGENLFLQQLTSGPIPQFKLTYIGTQNYESATATKYPLFIELLEDGEWETFNPNNGYEIDGKSASVTFYVLPSHSYLLNVVELPYYTPSTISGKWNVDREGTWKMWKRDPEFDWPNKDLMENHLKGFEKNTVLEIRGSQAFLTYLIPDKIEDVVGIDEYTIEMWFIEQLGPDMWVASVEEGGTREDGFADWIFRRLHNGRIEMWFEGSNSYQDHMIWHRK
jgi:hypothetical protein